MARMRFSTGRPRPRLLAVVDHTGRPPVEPGDAASTPAEPPDMPWSLGTWPYTDPSREEPREESGP